MEDRKFKGVWIPAPIFLHPNLSPLEKILWADIDSFTSSDGVFHKSNETIAEQLGVSERTVSRSIRNLQSLDMIWVDMNGGRHRSIKSRQIGEAGSSNWRGRVDNLSMEGRQNGEAGSPNCPPRLPIENTNLEYQLRNKGGLKDLPWDSDAFGQIWEEWLTYRQEAKLKSTTTSLKASLTRLVELSDGDEHTAIRIVHQSIANSWKGFFELKDKKHEQGITTDGLRRFIAEG